MAKKSELSAKQRAFVSEYLVDKNATKAAERAGYSKKTANEQGARLLAKASVKAAVQAALERQEKRTEITADLILRELLDIARSDIRELFDEDGNLRKIHDLPDGIAKAVAGIDVEELFEGYGRERTRIGDVKKVKLWNKVSALELLGKHLKLWIDRVEHDVTDELAERLERARKRVNGGSSGEEKP